MQFTRLRLVGFKSFVDATELVIAPGLTGVVGPNGCGKSNLLEALRWVMGENRPTAMRGGGMEDVIFAGAARRPARNYAEVSLSLDNSDRLAPAAFNTTDTLDVVRRITRDAGSAYKANGKEARARDVQMLFADASTGAHSPSLVRQGQISELINAKPVARRRVLEEAAGISGLYQRRHEAELKLKGTEANLARVDDVLEALTQQMGALARQVKQAARYREIAEALRRAEGALLFLRWSAADAARGVAATALTEALQAAGAAERAAGEAGRAQVQADAAVPPLREEAAIAGAVLQRQMVEKETLADRETRARRAIDHQRRQLETLRKDHEREATLDRDAAGEMARLAEEKSVLETDGDGEAAAVEAAAAATAAAEGRLAAVEAEAEALTGDVARLAARHQASQRRLEELAARRAKLVADVTTAETSLAEAEATLAPLAGQRQTSALAQEAAAAAAIAAETALSTAEAARADADRTAAATRADVSEADGVATALRAETGALEKLIARQGKPGGQILDAVTVAPGYEAALGAALADDLGAPLITGAEPTGWSDLGDTPGDDGFSEDVEPLSPQVTAPAALARRLARIGVVEADRGATLQQDLRPGQRLVSRAGDLWRWDGYRRAAGDATSATARLLEQKNRLAALSASLAEAEATATTARAGFDTARAVQTAATQAETEARTARRAADQAATQTERETARLESAEATAKGRVETLTLTLTGRREEAAQASEALEEAQTAAHALEPMDKAEAALAEKKAALATARTEMLGAKAAEDDLRRAAQSRARRLTEISSAMANWDKRRLTAGNRLAEMAERMVKAEADLQRAEAAPSALAEDRAKLTASLAAAEARNVAAADALAASEAALRQASDAQRSAERAASDAREARAGAEARAQAAGEILAAAAEQIMADLDQTPEALRTGLGDAPLPRTPEDAEAEVQKLRRQRDSLGAVNLRAEEDARAVAEEHDNLAAEKADLEEAVQKLRTAISQLNREGRQRLLDAFDRVNANFGELFKTLFGGGEANLVLVESDDPLDAGLEIMCQPPGKKLSVLSLLSGGEQTLTALSLIFAVFLANPSPICVLDEVDAPLDDANVTRFCDLLDSMTVKTDTRFLIITHHALTMSRMDRLFGVTMAEQGVSQLVSVDLRSAEAMVNA